MLLFPRRIHINRGKPILVNRCRRGVMPGILYIVGGPEPAAEAEIATVAPHRALQDKAEKPIPGLGCRFPDAVGFAVWAIAIGSNCHLLHHPFAPCRVTRGAVSLPLTGLGKGKPPGLRIPG